MRCNMSKYMSTYCHLYKVLKTFKCLVKQLHKIGYVVFLRYTDSDYPFGNFKLFLPTCK